MPVKTLSWELLYHASDVGVVNWTRFGERRKRSVSLSERLSSGIGKKVKLDGCPLYGWKK